MSGFSRLDGQVALLTGTTSDIGRAIALRLARLGADLALQVRDVERISDLVAALKTEGSHVVPVPLDLENTPEIGPAVQSVVDEFGRIDILVNNAANAGLKQP